MKIATISSKNQITLPQELIYLFGIKPGSKVAVEKNKNGILVSPIKKSIVDEVAGSLVIPKSKRNKSFEDIMSGTRKRTAYLLAQK